MKAIYFPAESRGHAHHGWLDTWHSFSFASYYNQDRMAFGKLRVLNDDTIAPGRGFDAHPHDNMEIITIPLEGLLAHQDSTGGKQTLQPGEVQRMTAGTGIIHSEYNASPDEPVSLLQIWIMPEKRNAEPKYDQRKFDLKENKLTLVVSQDGKEDSLDINQNARIWLGKYNNSTDLELPIANNHGLFIFLINGSAKVGNQVLNRRDAIGISEEEKAKICIQPETYLLAMEVPM
jgi:redox-sensitive bicupin YhaK (pirin superfamily)